MLSSKWESDDYRDWPLDTLVTVLLTGLPDGRTQVEFTQQDTAHGRTGTVARLEQRLHTHRRMT